MMYNRGDNYDNTYLVSWLRDAHGMETALIPVLENHAKDAHNHPQLQARINQHVEETRRHADLVKSALERLGSSPSAVKSVIGGFMGVVNSVATAPFEDEVVKNGLMDHATEHFEMASYKALAHAARQFSDEETARMCEQIMREEEEMARFLDHALPEAVDAAIMKKAQKQARS